MFRMRLSLSLAVGLLFIAALPGSLLANHVATSATITVTAGKPSELSFTLSTKKISAGTTIFKVTNKGKLVHSFKVCTKASATAKANSCTGVSTKPIKPGASATLSAKLSTKGSYEYLSTVAGQAASGMKGTLTVKAAPVSTPSPTPTTTTTTSTPTTAGGACASPQSTTVSAQLSEKGIILTPSTVHCGSITFNESNSGTEQHNLNVLSTGANGAGKIVFPGQTASFTATLGPATYTLQSDPNSEAETPLIATFTVTS